MNDDEEFSLAAFEEQILVQQSHFGKQKIILETRWTHNSSSARRINMGHK